MAAAWQPGRPVRKVSGSQIGSFASASHPSSWGCGRLATPTAPRKRGRGGWGKAGEKAALPGEVAGVSWPGACTAGICADICSRCGPAGLPNRHIESTSAAANRRISMRYGSLRRRCSRLTGCRVAACGGFSLRPARLPWWRGRTARSWAWPSCCFVLTAGWHGSILSRLPRNIRAAESHRPCWQRRRKSRYGANPNPCGLKFTKEIMVPLRFTVGPGIMSSVGTIITIRTAATRSGSRSNCRMTEDRCQMTNDGDWKSDIRHLTSALRKENSHDRLGHRR
jgi:hypothetical protein